MDVPLVIANPKGCQRENWLIDKGRPWAKVRVATPEDLELLVDKSGPIWLNSHSTSQGINDEVPLAASELLTSSLRLVRVESLVLSVLDYYGKRRVRGSFQHQGVDYRLSVTDPTYENNYGQKPERDYPIGPSFLTISLSEPFEKRQVCYKLIAAIIECGVKAKQ